MRAEAVQPLLSSRGRGRGRGAAAGVHMKVRWRFRERGWVQRCSEGEKFRSRLGFQGASCADRVQGCLESRSHMGLPAGFQN